MNSKRGSMLLVVAGLITVLSTLTLLNSVALRHVYDELNRVDARQRRQLAVGRADEVRTPAPEAEER